MRGYCYFYYFLLLFGFQICSGQQTIDTLRAPGFGVDMRFLDPLDPGRKSVIRSVPFNVFETKNESNAVLLLENASELRYEFVQTAYDF